MKLHGPRWLRDDDDDETTAPQRPTLSDLKIYALSKLKGGVRKMPESQRS